MKTLKLLTILLLTVFALSMKSQIYYALPTTNAVWTYVHYSWGYPNIHKVGMAGDTIINATIYKKIYYSTSYNFNVNNATYVCALREINKRVFTISAGNIIEKMLYDFNLTVGELATIYSYVPPSASSIEPYSRVVDSVDSVVINGQNHRRMKFNANSWRGDEYWIEGIGSGFGLLQPLFYGTDDSFFLLCMSIDNNIMYQYTGGVAQPFPGYDCDGFSTTGLV